MARIVHFVIAVDLDNKEVSIDDDVFMARFGVNESLYDTETQEWRSEDWDTEYLPALELLNTIPLRSE
jgi:hypothetical protein